ncbi:MAG: hypothetical protein EOS02_09805 [Mesorhizobium sp.]|nr:MAG: hypothetical protein EOS02_09805 [Mesorhizobium sp.]
MKTLLGKMDASDIVEAVLRLRKAFVASDLEQPLLITVDHDTYLSLRMLPPDVATSRYAAQGFDVVEIAGMRFTDRLPQGVFHLRD